MDKQQPRYVRITKQPDGANDWYRDYYRAKPIFEVRELPHNKRHYDVIGTNYVIAKSDCEPYEFPTLPTASEETPAIHDSDMTHLFTNKRLMELAHKTAYSLQHTSDYWRLKHAFWEGCKAMEQISKAAPVQEGHTITPHQLKDLYESLGEYSPEAGRELLAKIFPTVFKQERTYKVGDRFKIGYEYKEHVIALLSNQITDSLVALIGKDGRAWSGICHVKDANAITVSELEVIIGFSNGECQYDYKLIE